MSDTERRIGDLTVNIDRDACIGSGNCIKVAPELFELDDESIVVFARNAPAELSQVAEAAALPSIAVSLIAVIALLVVLYQSRTRWQLPDGSFWSPGYVATDMPSREVGAVAVNAKARLAPMLIAGLSFAVLIVLTVMSIAL